MVALLTGDKCLKVLEDTVDMFTFSVGLSIFLPSLPFLDYIIKTTQGPDPN